MKSTLVKEKLVAVKEITITRVEGNMTTGFVGKPFITQDWNVADDILIMLSQTAPVEGYDKTDFEIIFEDGFVYKGGYDLVHLTIRRPNLFAHVKDHLEFRAGVRKPIWMADEQYQHYLEGVNKDKYKEYLNKYLGIRGNE